MFPDAIIFTFALLLAEVLWLATFTFGVYRLDWNEDGISRMTRRFLVVGTVTVICAVTLAGTALWVTAWSYHPMYVIVIVLGFMPLDLLRYTKRLPERKPAS